MSKLAVMTEPKPAEAPRSGEANGYEISGDVVALLETRPLEAEAIRTIRTHVMVRHLHEGRRGLATCSPRAGAGCSFTAVNLAVSLAQVGVSTLLVDANLRNPGLQHFIRPPAEAAGVKQFLLDPAAKPQDFMHADVIPHLSLLYAGGAHDHAQELLGTERFKSLVESCLRDFDITIFDSPPAMVYADARRINTLVGYSMIVARRNVTLMHDVDILANQMHEDGVELLGAVLNEV